MAPSDEWQPIETAPKSGEFYIPILGFCADAPQWETLGEDRIRIIWWEPGIDSWQDGRHGDGLLYQPTHWMPLPSPPLEYRAKEANGATAG
jgi:hypothetical protein